MGVYVSLAHRHQEMLNANSTFLPALFYVPPVGLIFVCVYYIINSWGSQLFCENLAIFVDNPTVGSADSALGVA